MLGFRCPFYQPIDYRKSLESKNKIRIIFCQKAYRGNWSTDGATFGMLACVSAFWGLTNPVIKRNSKSITKIKSTSATKQCLLELKYLATNLDYLIPMGLNQVGSILYFLTLQNMDLTLSVPIANSLTFIFTALSASYLDESLPSKRVLTGAAFILLGTCLCCYGKR